MSEPKLDDITLRDLFAMFVLAGKAGSSHFYATTAKAAYDLADAMLKEREKHDS